ncbi:MAG TPA: hypothetical protein VN911_14750 [Candidatus Acidoferrum sp.]|nr:hypothetical protein [Candidatus Acidoferrum sp.]
MSDKLGFTMPGTVERIIISPSPNEPEKAQITLKERDHVFREIRIDNTLKNENGDDVSLKLSARVKVTVKAKP